MNQQLTEGDKTFIAGLDEFQALAPINRLPGDVLGDIFKSCCQDVAVRLPFYRCQFLPQAVLPHVCSLWRQIILQSPLIWNTVKIIGKMADTRTVAVAREWLHRARGLPCSLDLVDENLESECDYLYLQEHWYKNLVKELISIYRFNKLNIPFSTELLQEFLQLPDEVLACIEELCFRCTRHPFYYTNSSPPDFHKLTNLSSFCFRPNIPGYYHTSTEATFPHVPWQQLRHIQLEIATEISFCFTILQHCAAVIETCSMIITSDVHDSWIFKPICCPQLRRLKVGIYTFLVRPEEWYPIDSLLLSLTMPNLRSLALSAWYADRTPTTLLRVQKVSKMQLEELIIAHTGASHDVDVGVLLTVAPSLKRLELPSSISFTDDTMNSLGAGNVAPFLEDLSITLPDDMALCRILQMVKSRSEIRTNEPSTLRDVTLHLRREVEIPPEYNELIEEIKLRGVRFIVHRL